MPGLLRLVLTNAAAAALLAAVALVVSRLVRRPALTHALWLVALVKLVTPPLVPLPLLPRWDGPPVLAGGGAPLIVQMASGEAPGEDAAAFGSTRAPLARPPEAAPTTPDPRPAQDAQAPTVTPRTAPLLFSDPGDAALYALASGALLVLALTLWRFARFRRLLVWAEAAPPELAARAATLAARLGLGQRPRLLVVSARIPPMLWPEPGGARLLLPRDLLPELTHGEREALLAHELAHLRRRDHWVRLVETLATSLFWWYPVMWWTRGALRRAEERCCDEWVLRLLPGSAAAYASGLLKSLTFVSSAPADVPALASGASPLHELELRLKEIFMSRPVPHLPAPVRLALLSAAAITLAVYPIHAQEPRAAEQAAPAVAPAPAAGPRSAAPVPVPATAASPATAATRTAAPAPATAKVQAAAPVSAAAPAQAATPAPARSAEDSRSTLDERRRDLEQKRRRLERERLELSRHEIELRHQEIELRATSEQDALRAAAERLRDEGQDRQADAREKQAELAGRLMQLQRQRLELDAQQLELRMKLEAEALAQRDEVLTSDRAGRRSELEASHRAMERAEAERQAAMQGLDQKQRALEDEARAMEREIKALSTDAHARSVDEAREALTRALDERIAALERTPREAGTRSEIEHGIERLRAALAALRGDNAPSPSRDRTPAPQP